MLQDGLDHGSGRTEGEGASGSPGQVHGGPQSPTQGQCMEVSFSTTGEESSAARTQTCPHNGTLPNRLSSTRRKRDVLNIASVFESWAAGGTHLYPVPNNL